MSKLTKKAKHTVTELINMADEYLEISKKMKLMDNTKKLLSNKIKEATEELGVKDDKGSFYYDTGEVVTGKIAKKSVSLNEEKTMELLKKKGIYEEVVEKVVVEKINEEVLEQKIAEGIISSEEFEGICDVKTTYSVSVKEKAEMPEVETTVLKAASKK